MDIITSQLIIMNEEKWCTWMVAAYRQTHRPSWLASTEGWQLKMPSTDSSNIVSMVGWT